MASNGHLQFRSRNTNIVDLLMKRQWNGERCKHMVLSAAGAIAGPLLQAAMGKPHQGNGSEEDQGRSLAIAKGLPLPNAFYSHQSPWKARQPLLEHDLYYDALKVIVADPAKNSAYEEPLHLAVLSKNLIAVKCLLNNGEDPNICVRGEGNTLHTALKAVYFRESEIQNQFDIEADDDHSLYVCKILQLLLQAGANPTVLDDQFETPLHKAASEGFTAELEVLLKAFQQTGESTNCVNAQKNSVIVDVTNFNGLTPLYSARSAEIAQLLISYGASVNHCNRQYETILHYMCRFNGLDVARVLISSGARVNAQNPNGRTPLHVAVCWVREEMIQLLLTAGADVNARDKLRTTPLHIAAGDNLRSLVNILISAGAQVNACDENGNSPLHHSSGYREEADVKPPLPAVAEAWGRHLQARRLEVCRLLIALGANVNARNSIGQTPLHFATKSCRKVVVQELVRSGADVNARDEIGRSVFDLQPQPGWFKEVLKKDVP